MATKSTKTTKTAAKSTAKRPAPKAKTGKR